LCRAGALALNAALRVVSDEMPTMQISYELTEKDFGESFVAHRNRNALSKWSRKVFVWTVALCTTLAIIGFLAKPSAQGARNLLPLLALVMVWIAALWILPRRNLRRQFLKQPGAHGPRMLLLDSSGAHWRWNGGSSDIEWRNYIRSVEGKNQILFYTSPACFNILPKRVLAAEQLSEIRELLKQHIRVSG
jgi:YcxB-like protein